MSSNEERIRELTESVSTLSATVARGEARHRKAMRAVRWLAVSAICVTTLGLYVGTDAMKNAQAASDDTAGIAAQLAQLNQTIGQMAQGMGQMMQSPGFGQLISNGGVLAERLKQDSDAIRYLMFCRARDLEVNVCSEKIRTGELSPPPGAVPVDLAEAPEAMAVMDNMANIEKISKVLGKELEKLNNVLAAVPDMRNEMVMMRHDMHIMSSQMGVMAGSMGSTMGRMGSWMPW